ncbi:MAG: hypothetical protein VKK04_12795 [Synechococcales bacterium]|nr:hypothetical protein [Synechococcales bacterium]
MVSTQTRINPFPGLRPFDVDESHLFFGREGQIDEILRRLRQHRFLAIVGTSGSGKSSLVRAGLLPSLYSGFMVQAGSSWRVAVMRPSDSPIANLAQALNAPDVFGIEGEEARLYTVFTETSLRQGALGLVEVAQQSKMAAHENLLVVVDQFEELFRFKQSLHHKDAGDEASAFVKLLLEAVAQESVSIYVVLTMRSDFLGDCSQFRDLPEALNDSQYLVPRMTRDQRKSAIECPVAVGGATIAPRLVNRLLNDMGDNPDQLPILQHALMRTWDVWEQEHVPGEPIDLRHYTATGGMAKALSNHADEIYHGLPDDRSRQICELMFKRLTEKASDGRGIRRPTRVSDIAAVAGATAAEVIAVANAFRGPGKSFLMPPVTQELNEHTLLDISHESLMRVWERLDEWVEEEGRSARIYRRLAETASMYELGRAGYLRDPELGIALKWREETQPNGAWAARYDAAFEPTMAFLNGSVEARDRERAAHETARRKEVQRLRLFIGALATLLLLAVGTTVYALATRKIARKGEINAEIFAQSVNAKNLLNSNLELDALIKAIEVGKQVKAAPQSGELITPSSRTRAIGALQEVIYGLKEQNQLKGHSGWVNSVRFSPNGETIASAGFDSTVQLWSREGQPLSVLEGHSREVLSISFSPDGETIVSGGDDGTVRLWSVVGEALQILEGHSGAVRSISFSPDGETIVSGGNDGTVRLWSREGQSLEVLKGHSGWVNSVSFDSDGETIVSGGDDGTVRLWSREGQLLDTLEGHTGDVKSVSFSPDGETIVSGGDDGTVRLWDREGQALNTLEGHIGYVGSVSFSPDGQTIASAGDDAVIRLWKLGGQPLDALEGHSGDAWSISFSPDGQTIASAGDDGVRLWKLDGHPLDTLPPRRDQEEGHLEYVLSVSFSPDGHTIASAGGGGTVQLWSREGQYLDTLKSHSEYVGSVSFSPDGQTIASAGDDGTVRLWNREGQLLDTLEGHSGDVWSVSFSPDGQTIASAGRDGTVRLWDREGQLLDTILSERHEEAGHSEAVLSVSFSPDGRTIVSGGDDGTVRLWNTEGQLLNILEGHSGTVWSISFSPDGQTIASAGFDGTVRLWNKEGQPLEVLEGHSGYVSGLSFSPDGQALASAGNDGIVIVWNINLEDLLARGCAWIGDYLQNPTANLTDEERRVCVGF